MSRGIYTTIEYLSNYVSRRTISTILPPAADDNVIVFW